MKKISLKFLLMLIAGTAYGAQAILTADAPTTRVDGSAFGLSEITSGSVYWGISTPPTTKVSFPISSTNPSLATMTMIITLPVGTYYFGGTVTDQYGQESDMSQVIQKFIKPGRPSPHGAYK